MFTQYIQIAHEAATVTRVGLWYVNRDAVTSSRL